MCNIARGGKNETLKGKNCCSSFPSPFKAEYSLSVFFNNARVC